MQAFDLSFSGPHLSPKPTPRRRPKHGRYIFSSRRINLAKRSFKQILKCSTMADESKSRIQSVREWVVDHKLRTVGCLWLSGVTGSIAYNWSQPNMKTSVKIIHARLHAQALTLAALAGAALVEYYDHRTGAKAERVASFLESDAHTRRH